ncbi:MAG: TRAP transporter substrate-binding protein DctP [Spirochaetaceae bacterium]|jgi:TRAP-type C4-dicarboxylate transport system substrate-binding protein|nr:TRAP transporter substrate-binding protein DctP [Spirochaetaceae bacterium]
MRRTGFGSVVSGAILVSMCLLATVACEKKQGQTGVINIKFGNTQSEKDTQSQALLEVAKILNDSGKFNVDVQLNSALGSTDDLTEQAVQGAAILTVSDPARLATHVHQYGILGMPYILKSYEDVRKLNDIPSHKEWEAEFEKAGLKLVTSNWFSGTRHFVTNKEVNAPADLKGLRIRTLDNDIGIGTVNRMGAVGVGMSWNDVYPALTQKSLDGVEVQTVSSYGSKLYEVLSWTNRTGHFQLIGSVVTSADAFNRWPADAQELFIRTFREVGAKYQAITLETTDNYEKDMAGRGMTFHDLTPEAIQVFVDATASLYDEFGYGDLRKKVLAELQ